MRFRPSIIVLAALVAAPCLSSTAVAQVTPLPQRDALLQALQAAEAGRFDAVQYTALSGTPAWRWIELADLKRNIDTVSDARAQAFLTRYPGEPVADAFRAAWLPALSRRKDWAGLRANWTPQPNNIGLQCAELTARQNTGALDARWDSDAKALWLSTGKALPDACDPVFATLTQRGVLTPALRWQRFDLAIEGQQTGVM
ncbi:MAG: lytic murein transglycosylase, partial [Pseudoxanthomonas sp.]